MSINFYLEKRPNKAGENPIRAQVSIRSSVLISTIGYSVNPDVWNGEQVDERLVAAWYKKQKKSDKDAVKVGRFLTEIKLRKFTQKIHPESEEFTQKIHPETEKTTQKKIGKTAQAIIDAIVSDGKTTRKELAKITGRSENTIKYHLNMLQEMGIIVHIGSDRSGHWKVLFKK